MDKHYIQANLDLLNSEKKLVAAVWFGLVTKCT